MASRDTRAEKQREGGMSASAPKTKSALDTLLQSMDQLADSAAKKMTPDELRKTRKEINDSIDRVVAGGRQRRRETA
jgi:hypothetical protein